MNQIPNLGAESNEPHRGLKVWICHPTRQHSHRLAAALQERGWLARYLTAYPHRDQFPAAFRWLTGGAAAARNPALVSSALVRVHWPSGMFRVAARAGGVFLAGRCEYISYRMFDHWVARQLRPGTCDVIVGYENSAHFSFRKARELGMTTVLDAASLDYAMQDRCLGLDGSTLSRFERGVRVRKREEVRLADHVLTVSDLARDSYIQAGVAESKIRVMPMGVDLECFTADRKVGGGEFVFAMVGSGHFGKGIDLLHAAFSKVSDRVPSAKLWLVGNLPGEWRRRFGQLGSRVRIWGKVSHAELSRILAAVDCLVMPSRFDSFGLAALEALASGVPAIVSPYVGGRCALTEGRTGWIVPLSAEALADRMAACAQQPETVRAMAADCRLAAGQFTWNLYTARVQQFFSRFVPARPALAAMKSA